MTYEEIVAAVKRKGIEGIAYSLASSHEICEGAFRKLLEGGHGDSALMMHETLTELEAVIGFPNSKESEERMAALWPNTHKRKEE